jgi:hypothetical protein
MEILSEVASRTAPIDEGRGVRTTSWALPCLFSWAAVLVAGCTDAGKCTRGEEDCAPRLTDVRCDSGLIERDGRCVDGNTGGGRGGSGGGSGSGGGGAGGGSSGSGGGGVGGGNSGSGGGGSGGGSGGGGNPTPVDCEADSLEDGCVAFCEAFCRSEDSFCVASTCPPGACERNGGLYRECADACRNDTDPAACAVSLCEGQKEFTCEDFGYLDDDTGVYVSLCLGDDPLCVQNGDYGCSDVCGTTNARYGGVGADLVGDGICQDGGEGSANARCARGTDCTDCGTRTCAGTGDTCSAHGDCCGFYGEGSLCVELTTGAACLASCTQTGMCPSGQRCLEVDDNRNSVCAP